MSRSVEAKLKIDPDLPSLGHLRCGLLQCNRTIAAEAAFTFYQSNTFKFLGRHNWNPIVHWLKQIGAQNRGYLANLEVSAPAPVYVWQERDGTRELFDPDGDATLAICEPVYPRHTRFAPPSRSYSEGLAQNINPAVEQLFALLSCQTMGEKLTITLSLSCDYIPGVMRVHGTGIPSPDLDLPNFVEAVRAGSASIGDSRLIDVNWKGSVSREKFAIATTRLEESGWKIREKLEEGRDVNFLVLDTGSSASGLAASTSTVPFVDFDSHFLLRRKELTGPLTAEAPFSRSRLYGN